MQWCAMPPADSIKRQPPTSSQVTTSSHTRVALPSCVFPGCYITCEVSAHMCTAFMHAQLSKCTACSVRSERASAGMQQAARGRKAHSRRPVAQCCLYEPSGQVQGVHRSFLQLILLYCLTCQTDLILFPSLPCRCIGCACGTQSQLVLGQVGPSCSVGPCWCPCRDRDK